MHGSDSNKLSLNDTSTVFDVALSFSGKDRDLVHPIARALVNRGYSVFYDLSYQADLLGKDLVVWLRKIYGERSRHCLIFVSAHYRDGTWPNRVERQAILERSVHDDDYVIPIVLDESWIEGLPKTLGYLDARNHEPESVVRILCEKLGDPTLPKEEMSLYWSLMCNAELTGEFLFAFRKSDRTSYSHYGGWNSTLERTSRLGQLLHLYGLATVEYENDDTEPGVFIDLTETGKRFRRYLVAELATRR